MEESLISGSCGGMSSLGMEVACDIVVAIKVVRKETKESAVGESF